MRKIAIFDQNFSNKFPTLIAVVDTFDQVTAIIIEQFPTTMPRTDEENFRKDVEDMLNPDNEGSYYSTYSSIKEPVIGSVFAEYIDVEEGVANYILLSVYEGAEEVICHCTSDLEKLQDWLDGEDEDEDEDISSIITNESSVLSWDGGARTISIFKI
jgi:hypothetical protein